MSNLDNWDRMVREVIAGVKIHGECSCDYFTDSELLGIAKDNGFGLVIPTLSEKRLGRRSFLTGDKQ